MSDITSPPTTEATMEGNMVVSFIHFLREKMSVQRNPELAQSIEVAISCLEHAFGLSDASYAFQATKPLLELFAAEEVAQGETQLRASIEDLAEANKLKEEGNELMKDGHFHDAIEKYNKAVKLHKDPVYFCNRAAAYCRLEYYSLAVQDCRTALAFDPNYGKAYGRLGLALSCQNRYQEAVQAYKKAIELDPHQESYKNNLKIAEDKLRETSPRNAAQEGSFPTPLDEGNQMNPFASMMGNPQMMEMASTLMNNPNVQNMMSEMMNSEGRFGNFLEMGQQLAAQMHNANPDLVNSLRRQFERRHSEGDDQNPPRND